MKADDLAEPTWSKYLRNVWDIRAANGGCRQEKRRLKLG